MTLHIGEVTSEIEVQGGPGAVTAAGPPPEWDLAQRHRDLDEEDARRRARTAGGGFDD